MRAIHRKLLRDLWEIKGQVLAIAAVIGVGIAMFLGYLSTFDSLRGTQEAYYDRFRFADVFASAKRVPRQVETRIEEIPGVARVETRVVADVTLDVAGMEEPVTGHLVSIPETDRATLNDLALLEGRYLEPGRGDEVLVIEGFAEAHGLGPGDTVGAVINGRRRDLEIVGIALSPEFVYAIRPGAMVQDDARYGIFWMSEEALSSAFDMEGAFNDVVVRAMPGASLDAIIDRLDRLLEPYGGRGAIPRRLQISHFFLDNELSQLQGFGLVVPILFLSVAIFLLNVVLGRIVSVQREQIAALKALGYSDREIGLHYGLWSLAVAAIGCGGGIAFGRFMGGGMVRLYNDYFRFPFLEYELPARIVIGAVSLAVAAAIVGSWRAVRQAVALPPAEAMRPEPPARYRRTLVERLGLQRFLSQPARIVLRNLERQPLRSIASTIGIACSGGLLIIGLFFLDSIELILDISFGVTQRQDVTVSFVEPRSAAALHEVTRLPGVVYAEPARSVPARLVAGHRERQTSIEGLVDDARLQRIVDVEYQVRNPPEEGLLLSQAMADILGVGRGDTVRIEVLEGARPVLRAIVTDTIDEFLGTSVYMDAGALHRLMREGQVLTGAYLQIDGAEESVLYRQLKNLPSVAGVSLRSAALRTFREQMDEFLGVFIAFTILFASIITIGVVYNAARIILSERSRELASLRVLGFTRGEISSILLGELAVVTVLAVPLGLVFGRAFAGAMVKSFETELYRFPLVISPSTYATSALVVILAATLSGLLVRRKLDHLDLVEVLKSRE